MTGRRLLAAALGLAAGATLSLGFTPATPTTLATPKTRHPVLLLSTPTNADCGCGNSAKISGAPSQEARSINPREAILQSRVMRLDGTTVDMPTLLPDRSGVSLVVLTRSFG
jgi:hypothetical protein